jgi:hypothetical protein
MIHTLNTRFRTLLLLGVTLLALAMSGTAAFAGEDDDGDDEDDAPVPTQVAPAPVPVKPAPAQPAPAPAQPAPAAQPESKPQSKPVTHTQSQKHSQPSRSKQVSNVTRSTTGVQAAQVIPRGGVETGAGGTATTFTNDGPSPLVLGLGALLAFLLLGRGVRLAHARR